MAVQTEGRKVRRDGDSLRSRQSMEWTHICTDILARPVAKEEMEVKKYGNEENEEVVQAEKESVRMGGEQVAVVEEASARSSGECDRLAFGGTCACGSGERDARPQDAASGGSRFPRCF